MRLVFPCLMVVLVACAPSAERSAAECSQAQPFSNPQAILSTPVNWPGASRQIDMPLPQAAVDALEQTLDAIMRTTHATGSTAAIAIPGVGRWSAVRGLAKLEPKTPVTAEHRFHAASIGKLFTAVLTMQLIESGKLRLDTTIEPWFPDFPNARVITIGHLLSHTSGIYTAPTRDENNNALGGSGVDTAIQMAANHGNLFCPGAYWSYSNTGFMMLGRILERVRGQPMSQLVHELVESLGLMHTVFLNLGDESLLVEGHLNGHAVSNMNYAAPFAAGSIATTADDLLNFMHALQSGHILRTENLKRMAETFYPMSGYSDTLWYGKGLMLFQTPIGQAVGHAGGIVGFNSILWYFPDSGALAAMMFNDDGNDTSHASATAGAFTLLKAAFNALTAQGTPVK